MSSFLSVSNDRYRKTGAKIPEIGFCEEKNRLLNEFLKAVRETTAFQVQQTQAVIDGDSDFTRFDVLLHMAQEKKERAKYAWITHVEEHRCGEQPNDTFALKRNGLQTVF